MDIFIEEMVKKKKSSTDSLCLFGVVAFCVFLSAVLFTVVIPAFPQLSSIVMLVILAIVYITYILAAKFNLEYEYALVNSEMDVDKIEGKKRRKSLATVNLRGLEFFGNKTSPEFDSCLKNPGIKKIYACRDKSADDVYFVVFNDGAEKKMLIFSPSDKIISVIEKLNPKRVAI